MSEIHEETHYQIALTNRQVLTAFVILLGCLFVAFFAGVRIGRDALSGADNVAASNAAEASDETGRDELAFFTRTSGARRGSDEPGSGNRPGRDRPGLALPTPENPQRSGLEASAEPPGAVDDPLVAEELPSRSEQADRDPDESGLPAPVVMRPGELVRRADPPRPATASGSPAIIQVFSSTDRSQAESILDRLSSAGFKAYLSPFTIDGQEHYRVRVGPLPDRAQAVEQADRLERELGLDTWIPSTLD